MKLRQYFMTQSVLVLTVTVVITACLSLLFGALWLRPPDGADEAASDRVALFRGETLLYNGTGLSEFELKELRLGLKMGEGRTELGSASYGVSEKSFFAGEEQYALLEMKLLYDLSPFYRRMILFVITVFLITFLISSIVAQRANVKNIIRPVVRLTEETGKLADGELGGEVAYEGCGEVGELTLAVESLRLRLRKTVAEQERYDDNRKFLTSSISHDLKTPVTAVRGYIEGVLDGVADTEEKRREYLAKARQKTMLITSMIDDLLLYSKLDLNQLPFHFEHVDIGRYLEDYAEDVRPAFAREEKTVAFTDCLPGPVFVRIDAERFRRVVQNITDNARTHIEPKSGELRIVLRQNHASVIVEFADNGAGIDKKDLPHIFERFYRADSARRVEGSSGLGLAIAKALVTGMEGRIWAVSEPGQGSSVMISLKKMRIAQKSTEDENEKNTDHRG